MDFSPWDWATNFRLHEAACLIAGVMPSAKRIPDREELPAQAIPVLLALVSAHISWVIKHDQPEDPLEPKAKMLKGILVYGSEKPALVAIAKQPGEIVSREELHLWIQAMEMKSVYQFLPSEKNIDPQLSAAALAQTATTPSLAPVVAESESDGVEPAKAGPVKKSSAKPATNWRMQIQAEAYEYWVRLRASGCNPTPYSICGDMAKWCIEKNIKGGKGQSPSAGTIMNTVLCAGHWTPPHHSVKQAKEHVAQIARTAQT